MMNVSGKKAQVKPAVKSIEPMDSGLYKYCDLVINTDPSTGEYNLNNQAINVSGQNGLGVPKRSESCLTKSSVVSSSKPKKRMPWHGQQWFFYTAQGAQRAALLVYIEPVDASVGNVNTLFKNNYTLQPGKTLFDPHLRIDPQYLPDISKNGSKGFVTYCHVTEYLYNAQHQNTITLHHYFNALGASGVSCYSYVGSKVPTNIAQPKFNEHLKERSDAYGEQVVMHFLNEYRTNVDKLVVKFTGLYNSAMAEASKGIDPTQVIKESKDVSMILDHICDGNTKPSQDKHDALTQKVADAIANKQAADCKQKAEDDRKKAEEAQQAIEEAQQARKEAQRIAEAAAKKEAKLQKRLQNLQQRTEAAKSQSPDGAECAASSYKTQGIDIMQQIVAESEQIDKTNLIAVRARINSLNKIVEGMIYKKNSKSSVDQTKEINQHIMAFKTSCLLGAALLQPVLNTTNNESKYPLFKDLLQDDLCSYPFADDADAKAFFTNLHKQHNLGTDSCAALLSIARRRNAVSEAAETEIRISLGLQPPLKGKPLLYQHAKLGTPSKLQPANIKKPIVSGNRQVKRSTSSSATDTDIGSLLLAALASGLKTAANENANKSSSAAASKSFSFKKSS